MYRDVQGWTGMDKDVWMDKDGQECMGMYGDVQGCTRKYEDG